ncbi:hypothetical protein N7494_000593 [Penicillium frequentans]|uniref:Major facilitator superfamily (MFS) profile domain-containing protein n=1 Tax=Penicillium frequentans TaxID=3151616 RepID=A0AAD6D795_9EURO|nr:hypothetical protein N7494_000593 [Penicillium glabrum]
MGLLQDFFGLMAARFFSGLAEAGLSPGISYCLSYWYRRSEYGLRLAVSYSSAALAGSFGGLLAAAILKMDGVGNKPGWTWIFILEGLGTIVKALLSFWLLADFPDKADFLSDSDKHRVCRRLTLDQFDAAGVGSGGSLYAFSLFLPTIVEEMAYASTTAQLFTVAPDALAFLTTIIVGYMGIAPEPEAS